MERGLANFPSPSWPPFRGTLWSGGCVCGGGLGQLPLAAVVMSALCVFSPLSFFFFLTPHTEFPQGNVAFTRLHKGLMNEFFLPRLAPPLDFDSLLETAPGGIWLKAMALPSPPFLPTFTAQSLSSRTP